MSPRGTQVGLTEDSPTGDKLCSRQLSSGQEVVHGTLLRHRLQVQPTPVIPVVQLTGVQLSDSERRP